MLRKKGFFAVALSLASIAAGVAARAAHSHSSTGPHGGDLLELAGNYHAELVLDEPRHQVSVYLLDGSAEQDAPIDAPFLNVNARANGKPLQFRLTPVRPKGETTGPASCFAITSQALVDALHDPAARPRLSFRIGKKAYVVQLTHHHHDHEAHAHGAGDVRR